MTQKDRDDIADEVVKFINWDREQGDCDLRSTRHCVEYIIRNGLTFEQWRAEVEE